MNHPETHKACSNCGWNYCNFCEDKCPNCYSSHYDKCYHDAWDCKQTLNAHNSNVVRKFAK